MLMLEGDGDGIFEKSHIFTGFMDANQWSLRLIAALLTKIEFQEKNLKPWGKKVKVKEKKILHVSKYWL